MIMRQGLYLIAYRLLVNVLAKENKNDTLNLYELCDSAF